jgi:ribosomal protein S16
MNPSPGKLIRLIGESAKQQTHIKLKSARNKKRLSKGANPSDFQVLKLILNSTAIAAD